MAHPWHTPPPCDDDYDYDDDEIVHDETWSLRRWDDVDVDEYWRGDGRRYDRADDRRRIGRREEYQDDGDGDDVVFVGIDVLDTDNP
jgi:hypothetical protein